MNWTALWAHGWQQQFTRVLLCAVPIGFIMCACLSSVSRAVLVIGSSATHTFEIPLCKAPTYFRLLSQALSDRYIHRCA